MAEIPTTSFEIRWRLERNTKVFGTLIQLLTKYDIGVLGYPI
jgi:hypothetical protein